MAGKAAVGFDLDPAEDERDAFDQGMRVDSDADSQPSGSWRRSRRSKTVTVS